MFEVRPEQVGEIQLGIGQLPQQEIADAVLATGADAQVGQRQVARCQARLQQFGGDVFRAQMPGLHFTRQALGGLGDIPLTTVVGGDLQDEAIAACGQRLGLAGWVRNRLDGSVEAVVCGPVGALQALIDWAQSGPMGARVDRVVVSEAEGVFEGFEQRETA